MAYEIEFIAIDKLKPHPRNYVTHDDVQLAHLEESIREHGLYRNIVIAKDGTILAGHGVVEAAKRLGYTEVPVHRLPLAPLSPRALKILTGDNEISHLADKDDRALSELLKEIKETDENGLLGTGYDNYMLAALVMVTRPASEIADFNEAAEWVGMPEYDPGTENLRVIVNFRNNDDRLAFSKLVGFKLKESGIQAQSIWWPERKDEDLSSLRLEGKNE